MNISRDNYESWFLDYIDGKLDAGQSEMLMSFLEFNPDLKSELIGLEEIRLDAGKLEYDLKASLQRSVNFPVRENLLEKFEDYCIASIEQQLSPSEENLLQKIIEEDKEKHDLFKIYQATVLTADDKLQFSGKAGLKKKYIDIPSVRISIAAIAAAAVLLLVLPWLFIKSTNQTGITQNIDTGENSSLVISEEPLVLEKIADDRDDISADGSVAGNVVHSNDIAKTGSAEMSPNEKNDILWTGPDPDQPARDQIHLSRIEPIKAEVLPDHRSERFLTLAPGIYYPEMNTYSANRQGLKDQTGKILSFWSIADAGVQRINKLTEKDYSLERETDNEGRIQRLTFETPLFGISTPVRNHAISQ